MPSEAKNLTELVILDNQRYRERRYLTSPRSSSDKLTSLFHTVLLRDSAALFLSNLLSSQDKNQRILRESI